MPFLNKKKKRNPCIKIISVVHPNYRLGKWLAITYWFIELMVSVEFVHD